MTQRIKYLDAAKFIGIFCIYLGHFEADTGKGYEFVFAFHVALFFFISGCTEALGSELPWHKYILKIMRTILLPYVFFALLALAVRSLSINSHSEIIPGLVTILKGCIRNQFIAGSLWFLTCLFVMKLVFYFIRRLLKHKLLILAACLALFAVAETLIDPKPLVKPHMLFNLDSACYYIIFYGLGYCSFDLVRKLLNWDRPVKKLLCAAIGTVCLVYAVALFFGKDVLMFFDGIPFLASVCALVRPVMIIALVMLVAKLLENVKFLCELGKNTLYLCGCEYVIKLLTVICLYTLGSGLSMPDPLSAYLYSFGLLVLCNFTLVPMVKALFKKLRLI